VVFLLAFAQSVHAQPVPVNFPLGCRENHYAKFSQWGKKNTAIQNGQVKQLEEEFLCPLPCATVGRIRICHSISLICIARVAVIIRNNLQFYRLPITIPEITLCWWVVYVKIRFLEAPLMIADKRIFSPTNRHHSERQYYFSWIRDQSVYFQVANSDEILTQCSMSKWLINFSVSYGQIVTAQCCQ
jgi:hypothetical protein